MTTEPKFKERIEYIPTRMLVPKADQPREEFDDEGLEELGQSMKESGQLVPIIVQETEGRYEICAGERRFRAAERSGIRKLACIIMEDMEPKYILLYAAIENLLRKNLKDTEIEKTMFSLYNEGENGWTMADLAQMIGKQKSWVQIRIDNHRDRNGIVPAHVRDVPGVALLRTRPVKDEELRTKLLEISKISGAGPGFQEITMKARKIETIKDINPKAAEDLKKAYIRDEVDEDDIEIVAQAVQTTKELKRAPEEVKRVALGAVAEVKHQKAEEKATLRAIESARTHTHKAIHKEARGEKVEPTEIEVLLPAHEKIINKLQGTLRDLKWNLDVELISVMPEGPQKRLHQIIDEISRTIDERMMKIKWKD